MSRTERPVANRRPRRSALRPAALSALLIAVLTASGFSSGSSFASQAGAAREPAPSVVHDQLPDAGSGGVPPGEDSTGSSEEASPEPEPGPEPERTVEPDHESPSAPDPTSVVPDTETFAAQPRLVPLAQRSVKESWSSYNCPADAALTRRAHSGDENGTTTYTCALMRFEEVQVRVGPEAWAGTVTESAGTWLICPPSTVLTGRDHYGDENGSTVYRCAPLELDGQPLSLDEATWSAEVNEKSHDYTCPSNGLLVGRMHSGDENGRTRYACAAIRFDRNGARTGTPDSWKLSCPLGSAAARDNGTGFACARLLARGVPAELLSTTQHSWMSAATHDVTCETDSFLIAREFRSGGAEMRLTCGAFAVESDRIRWTGTVRGQLIGAPATDCPPGSLQVGRKRSGGGAPTVACADVAADHNAVFAATVAANARAQVGVPATLDPGRFADRDHLALSADEYLHLAVGGEGRSNVGAHVTGFDRAVNLSHKTKNAASKDIPNLVQVYDPLLAPPYPFTAATVDYLTVENRQLTRAQAGEIVRVLKPKGTVGLWLDMGAQVGFDGRQDTIVAELAKALQSTAGPCVDEFGSRTQYEKVCIVDRR